MPILRNINLPLNMEQILRRLGTRNQSKVQPQIMALLQELFNSTDELHLLEPGIAYVLYPITELKPDQVCLVDGTVLSGSLLPSTLASARELAMVVCTVGAKLEEMATDLFDKGKPTQGLLLDSIGSAAVDCLTQEVCKYIRQEAATRGYQVSSPITPGMPGLPLTEQYSIFKLVPAEQIGVHLTSSAMMIPRKSASMFIGIGADMPTWTQAEVCNRCNMKKVCLYKVPGV